jgi:hypothetical protein
LDFSATINLHIDKVLLFEDGISMVYGQVSELCVCKNHKIEAPEEMKERR